MFHCVNVTVCWRLCSSFHLSYPCKIMMRRLQSKGKPALVRQLTNISSYVDWFGSYVDALYFVVRQLYIYIVGNQAIVVCICVRECNKIGANNTGGAFFGRFFSILVFSFIALGRSGSGALFSAFHFCLCMFIFCRHFGLLG